jgi:transposase InsO family protein
MVMSLLPLQMIFLMLAGWVNRRQLQVIEYLEAENRVLRERLGGRRIRFTDAERCQLARKAHAIGRNALHDLETLVTPDTLLRWYRQLIARKWNYSHRRSPGRPRVMRRIVDLILQMSSDNPSWGYTRIRGALSNLGHEVGRGTIASILKDNGIEPAPELGKRTRWSTFLKAHWECVTAADFLSVEVCTLKGLVTYYILFLIDLSSRRVHIAGVTAHPENAWMMQVARNVTDLEDAVLRGKRYLILDRDARYSEEFRGVLTSAGVHVIRLPPRSPNLNAFAERFVRSIKEECLSRMIFFGVRSLRYALAEYGKHYHCERNHQGLRNRIPQPGPMNHESTARIRRRRRLGGMLSYYHRQAA